MNQDDLIKTLTGNLEKMFGPSPHKEHFAALLSNLLADIEKGNVVGNGDVYQLLVEVAWKWPGEPNDQWAILVGLCAVFFHRAAVESSAINLPEAGHA